MDSVWGIDDNTSGSISDPFASVEIDAFNQTGSDWFNLMLTASVGGRPVHGVTFAATCETLAKSNEHFAKKHAVGRVGFSAITKAVPHAGDEWDEQVLMGKAFHGTKTGNKARILFDTGEWEPSIRTRAKNAAITGALLVNTGSTLDEAKMVISAIAGEPVPEDAIINAETPLSILKREASSIAKSNHIVYGKGNAQQAITWADHQMHVDKLPLDAAMDWSRVTTIARYLGEANSRYDPDFQEYARVLGVPYVLITKSWAHVNSGDYIIDTDKFATITTELAKRTPGPELMNAYSDHQQNLYDAIHRMAAELEVGVTDPTMDALVHIAMAAGSRGNNKTRKVATGNEVIAEATRHTFGADEAAAKTADSATSWNSLVASLCDLKKGAPALARAFNEAHLSFREGTELPASVDIIYSELAKSAVWIRASHHLAQSLGNTSTAHARMSTLKRSMLNNSATLFVSQNTTSRIREALQMRLKTLVRDVAVGKVPRLAIPIAPSLSTKTVLSTAMRSFMANIAKHLNTSKVAWATRYSHLAATYGVGKTDELKAKAVKFGTCSTAFSMLTSTSLLAIDDGFIDKTNFMGSYLVHSASNYRRKRGLPKLDPVKFQGITAAEQAVLLDDFYKPQVSFVSVELFCREKLTQFHDDIKDGMPKSPDDLVDLAVAPNLDSDGDVIMTPPEEPDVPASVTTLPADLMAAMSLNFSYKASPDLVMQSYNSEAAANTHAVKNGYSDFYAAFAALGEGARYDIESKYTVDALEAIHKEEKEHAVNSDEFAPALEN